MANNDVILEKLKGIEKLFNEKFAQNDQAHKEIFKQFERKAGKWTERVLGIMMLSTVAWTIKQLLELITTVHAIFN